MWISSAVGFLSFATKLLVHNQICTALLHINSSWNVTRSALPGQAARDPAAAAKIKAMVKTRAWKQ
jgi:hypothetical protein